MAREGGPVDDGIVQEAVLAAGMPFGDHMVLQRQKEIAIWGTGRPGSTVAITLADDESVRTTIASDGTWSTSLPPHEAGHDLRLTLADERTQIVFTDVAIGEVWLAGGQSNMEYFLAFDADRRDVLNRSANPDIRYFDSPRTSYEGQLEEYDYSRFGFWRTSTPEDLPYFSAVGYYFAAQVQASLGVPVGIVGCNWGGTPACAWMSEQYLEAGEGRIWLDEHRTVLAGLDVDRVSAEYRADPANAVTDPLRPSLLTLILSPGLPRLAQKALVALAGRRLTEFTIGPLHPWRPAGLYEVMLKRIAPYTTRGVIWYQGESDAPHAEIYADVFSSMIRCWRDLWREEMPFLFAQLAPFGEWLGATGEAFPELRRQQQIVADTVPSTWMASSSDAGLQWDIHPKRKEPIGERLALLARHHVYGQRISGNPPRFLSGRRTREGIEVRFTAAEGLRLGQGTVPLDVRSPSGRSIPVTGLHVEGDHLAVSGSFPPGSVVSFAWTGYYDVPLVNGAGNPVTPFQFALPVTSRPVPPRAYSDAG